MTCADVVGAVGILPTPATANADRWDAQQTVDLTETARMVEAIVAGGIEILMTTATFGDAPTLLWDELQAFADCVIHTAAPRPVFIGVTTLNTRETIARARTMITLGAAGIFTGRPMWTRLSDAQIVQYYRDLAAALPGVPLVVYDNPRVFRGKISLDVFGALATIPEVIAVRQVGGPETDEALAALGERVRFMPNDREWFPSARRFPDRARACWSGNVACGPGPIVALGRAIAAGDWDDAERIHDELRWAGETMYPSGTLDDRFSDYSTQLYNLRVQAAGFIHPGPTRPPYTDVPKGYVAGAREVGRRLRALHDRYAGART